MSFLATLETAKATRTTEQHRHRGPIFVPAIINGGRFHQIVSCPIFSRRKMSLHLFSQTARRIFSSQDKGEERHSEKSDYTYSRHEMNEATDRHWKKCFTVQLVFGIFGFFHLRTHRWQCDCLWQTRKLASLDTNSQQWCNSQCLFNFSASC